MMKGLGNKITKTITVLTVLMAMVLMGCAPVQSGKTSMNYDDQKLHFVPRIHIEDDSFGVSASQEYYKCSYDMEYEGYWCLKFN